MDSQMVAELCHPQLPPAWEILVLSEHRDQRWGDRLGNGGPRMEAATCEAEA